MPRHLEQGEVIGRVAFHNFGPDDSRARYDVDLSGLFYHMLVRYQEAIFCYEEARATYAKEPAKAKQLATEPLGPAPEGSDVTELAAWTTVANVLLNLDETLMRL